MTIASCDCCGEMRYCRPARHPSIETSACWECRGGEPECSVCGEELVKDEFSGMLRCTWCFGDPRIGEIRAALQKMRIENEVHLATLERLAKSWAA